MGDRRIFLKTFRASLFNEPNVGRIHLAGSSFKLKSLNFLKSSKHIEHVTEMAQFSCLKREYRSLECRRQNYKCYDLAIILTFPYKSVILV
jgi:hypothetical protein